jgi:hypothetical protein
MIIPQSSTGGNANARHANAPRVSRQYKHLPPPIPSETHYLGVLEDAAQRGWTLREAHIFQHRREMREKIMQHLQRVRRCSLLWPDARILANVLGMSIRDSEAAIDEVVWAGDAAVVGSELVLWADYDARMAEWKQSRAAGRRRAQ